MLATLETTPSNPASSSINEIDINGAGGGTRNRINGSSSKQKTNSTTMMEDPEDGPTLDCVICYSPIDVHNVKKYMLAPCEHLFHRDCLEQWMDVKMECPICRKDLPTL